MIKPILKYTGAKWRLAPWIVSFFPAHYHYVEPYCGSAACFFIKPPAEHEVLNDLNGSMINLFQVIRTRGEELAAAIAMTPWSEAEYELLEKDWFDEDELEHARKFLIRCWQAHGGTIYQVSKWKHNGLNGRAFPVRLWRQLPDRLLAIVDRLQDAELRSKPALEIIEYYDAPNVLLYVDPPYIQSTRARKYYPYEMTDGEHLAMLEALKRHRGMIILSGYPHPLYDEQLKDWYRISTPAAAEHGKQQIEVLWLNPKATGAQQLRMFTESEATA